MNRQTRSPDSICFSRWFKLIGVTVWLGVGCFIGPLHAQSALDLVAGFDQERIEAVHPISNREAVEEAAKLVYRMNKVRPASFAARVDGAYRGDESSGDAVKLSASLVEKKLLAVPEALADVLGLQTIVIATLQFSGDDLTSDRIEVIASSIPKLAKVGDRLTIIGMMVHRSPESTLVVAAKVKWFPRKSSNESWQWLSVNGVDVSELSSLATRDRRPLVAADADAFYSIMAVAGDDVGQPNAAPPPEPKAVAPIDLLRQPNGLIGRYLTLPVEIIQVTRIGVTESNRRSQLGSDHYFQVDAVGDLGNVIIKIEPSDAGSGDHDATGGVNQGDASSRSATFQNRYPISMVMRTLPPFLQNAIDQREGGAAVISDVNMMVQVDGFFFRLWSYETDYMKQFGGDQQFGPLLIAAKLQNLETDSDDPLGVQVIGWIATTAIGLGILVVAIWHRRTSSEDALVRKQRREKAGRSIDVIDLP